MLDYDLDCLLLRLRRLRCGPWRRVCALEVIHQRYQSWNVCMSYRPSPIPFRRSVLIVKQNIYFIFLRSSQCCRCLLLLFWRKKNSMRAILEAARRYCAYRPETMRMSTFCVVKHSFWAFSSLVNVWPSVEADRLNQRAYSIAGQQ